MKQVQINLLNNKCGFFINSFCFSSFRGIIMLYDFALEIIKKKDYIKNPAWKQWIALTRRRERSYPMWGRSDILGSSPGKVDPTVDQQTHGVIGSYSHVIQDCWENWAGKWSFPFMIQPSLMVMSRAWWVKEGDRKYKQSRAADFKWMSKKCNRNDCSGVRSPSIRVCNTV